MITNSFVVVEKVDDWLSEHELVFNDGVGNINQS
jgi:hypothetical protein